jgi:hypothetical protein
MASPGLPAVAPVWVGEVEAGGPPVEPRGNGTYERALVLVRVHGVPVGVADVAFGEDLAARAADAVRDRIDEHLACDAGGIGCEEERERALRRSRSSA